MEPALRDDFNFNVLVVDDDKAILGLLREIMEMVPGCHITTASEPSEAVKVVLNGKIDIVFTDIHMPNHTGLEFLEDLIKLEQTPEVIVMTAYPNGDDAQKAMELGATSFIAKPFEDIRVVELELEKAIKKIIRQRSAEKEVELKKLELSKASTQVADNDPVMKVSIPLPELPPETVPAIDLGVTMPPVPKLTGVGAKLVGPERKVYDIGLVPPFIEVEVERCRRHKRQFVLGYIDLPEAAGGVDREAFKLEHRYKLESLIRRSDILFDAGQDRFALLGFECNRVGADVLESKLAASGFPFSAFSVYPNDGQLPSELMDQAKHLLGVKRKLQVVIFEPDEFFGRLVTNMLSDPKYHVVWLKTHQEFYQHMTMEAESVRLVVLSLSKDKEQWRLMAKMMREGLVKWPVLLFVDVSLTKEVKDRLSQLAVKAIVHRGASQEEFLYLVQSFVVPKPAIERKNFRALVSLPITYQWNQQSFSSVSFTLSRDGIFVRDLTPPPSGEIIDLKLFIPGRSEAITTRAEVLYAVPYFIGVSRFHVAGFAAKFVELSDEYKSFIDEIVNKSMTSYLL